MPIVQSSVTAPWEPKVIVNVDPDRVFTTVIIVGHRWTGVGVAKRNPRDAYDSQFGHDVAFARALRELADATERFAGVVI